MSFLVRTKNYLTNAYAYKYPQQAIALRWRSSSRDGFKDSAYLKIFQHDCRTSAQFTLKNIPSGEIAQIAFFSLYRPLLDLHSRFPILNTRCESSQRGIPNLLEYKYLTTQDARDTLPKYLAGLRPFQPPEPWSRQPKIMANEMLNVNTPQYILDENTDYLALMQEKLKRQQLAQSPPHHKASKRRISTRRRRTAMRVQRIGFFEKN